MRTTKRFVKQLKLSSSQICVFTAFLFRIRIFYKNVNLKNFKLNFDVGNTILLFSGKEGCVTFHI